MLASMTTPGRWSFVIPAWNEADLLPSTIEAIRQASRDVGLEYEIVVADDRSSDGTAATATACGARVVSCDNRQIAATRNAGALAARGRVLVFVDADTRITPAALAGTLEAVAGGAVYGGADVTWDGHVPLWSRALLRGLLWAYPLKKVASGAFLFCTREAFEAAGRFDESLYAAEEYELSRALSKQGPYAWIRERVVTSGRKLRTHSARKLLGDMLRLSLRGRRGMRDRKHKGLWYDDRDPDPHRPPDHPTTRPPSARLSGVRARDARRPHGAVAATPFEPLTPNGAPASSTQNW